MDEIARGRRIWHSNRGAADQPEASARKRVRAKKTTARKSATKKIAPRQTWRKRKAR
jgi:hypothetical protein